MTAKDRDADVWIGDYGMQITEKGSQLCLTARFCRETGNLDHFLAELRSAISLWCTQHPYSRTRPVQPIFRVAESARRGRTRMRLPQNADEMRELEELAEKGPVEVYKWVYGAESLMTRAMYGVSWKQFGVDKPAHGCRRLLDAIREHNEDLRIVRPQSRRKS
jgi:hypothetical protein